MTVCHKHAESDRISIVSKKKNKKYIQTSLALGICIN